VSSITDLAIGYVLVSVGSMPLFSCCGCEADGVYMCWKKMDKCTRSACDQPILITKLTRRSEGNILRSLRPQLLLALSKKSLHSPTCQACDYHVLLAVCWGLERMEKRSVCLLKAEEGVTICKAVMYVFLLLGSHGSSRNGIDALASKGLYLHATAQKPTCDVADTHCYIDQSLGS